jgi:transketolase C-terminal domain/subunit
VQGKTENTERLYLFIKNQTKLAQLNAKLYGTIAGIISKVIAKSLQRIEQAAAQMRSLEIN